MIVNVFEPVSTFNWRLYNCFIKNWPYVFDNNWFGDSKFTPVFSYFTFHRIISTFFWRNNNLLATMLSKYVSYVNLIYSWDELNHSNFSRKKKQRKHWVESIKFVISENKTTEEKTCIFEQWSAFQTYLHYFVIEKSAATAWIYTVYTEYIAISRFEEEMR